MGRNFCAFLSAAVFLAKPALAQIRAPAEQATRITIDAGEVGTFVDPIIAAQMEKEHIPGAVFVLVQDGKILYKRGYGFADIASRKPVDPVETIWRIGSISKVFTATAVVQLADRGQFRLSDDVNRYMRRFKVPATYPEPVRFWHLLTHTAGLDEIRPGTRAETEAGLLPLGDFLAPKLVRLRPPGQVISYSTYGITLGGYLVEQVSGMEFEKYLSRNIWLPLGMTRTNIVVPDSLKSDLAATNGIAEQISLPAGSGITPRQLRPSTPAPKTWRTSSSLTFRTVDTAAPAF